MTIWFSLFLFQHEKLTKASRKDFVSTDVILVHFYHPQIKKDINYISISETESPITCMIRRNVST